MSISVESVFGDRGESLACTGCGTSPVLALLLVDNKPEYEKRLAEALEGVDTDEKRELMMFMCMRRADLSVELCERCLEVVAGGLALMCPSRHGRKRRRK